MSKEIIAAFDFDGTLTTGMPSRILFLKHLVGLPKMLGSVMFCMARTELSGFKSGQVSWHDDLDYFLLKGRDKDELNEQALFFMQRVLINKLRKEALERLDFHQQQGHTCVIVSGAWDIYLKPLAQQYNFKHLICTELEFDPSNKSTGYMRNDYCLGIQKLDGFKKQYANRNDYILYAYGDSVNDLALLNYADHAFYRCFR